jgi:hypothetical protein
MSNSRYRAAIDFDQVPAALLFNRAARLQSSSAQYRAELSPSEHRVRAYADCVSLGTAANTLQQAQRGVRVFNPDGEPDTNVQYAVRHRGL